jgi:O-antigen/teichoic acid export membrane protein
MTMRKKAFQSGIAVMGSSLTVQLSKTVSTIVLARLLEPSDFGIVSLAAVLIGATELFSGMGMGAALIASKEENNKAAYHGTLITVPTGTLLMVFVMALSPQFAYWFGREELSSVCRWMAVLIFFQTVAIVPNSLLMKDMMFGRLVFPRTIGPLSNMVTAMTMAYSGFGYWSLVAGHIVGSIVSLITLLIVCPSLAYLRPRKWESSVAKAMAQFGVTNMGVGIVRYIYNQGDYVVVGKALGATQLGFYSQAYNISNLPVNTVSSVANAVLFPAYAKIRDSKERLAKAFLNSFGMVSVISVPIALGLLVLAPELVIFLIGEKWRSSIPVLQIFAIMSLLRPLSGTTAPLFLAVNRPGFSLTTAIIQCSLMLILIFTFLPWGTSGVALGVVCAFAIGFAYNIYLTCWRTGVPIRVGEMAGRIAPCVLSATFMVGVVIGLKQPSLYLVGGTHNALSLGILVSAGVLSYTLGIYVLKRSLVFEILELLRSAVSRKGKRLTTKEEKASL